MSCTFKLVLAVVLAAAPQDEKKAPVDPKPRIAMSLPLAISPGTTSKVTLRGLNLDQASEVKFAEPVEGATIAVKSKGKAELPKETDPALYGDTKVEIEIQLPAEFSAGKIGLVAVNPAGQTAPYEVAVLAKDKVVLEKEPNGGAVQGAVSQALDVDVFRIMGKRGEVWTIEVEAQRRGSILDAMLSIHTQDAKLLAAADDSASSRDPVLRVTLPADGAYFVTVMDAHNSGGATHAYLLRVGR